MEGERIGLTLWDSRGFQRNVVDLQLRDMTGFLESKFEETLAEEMKVVRAPGVRDTHIHCVFLVLDPVRLDECMKSDKSDYDGVANSKGFPLSMSCLDEKLDLQVLRALQGKTTVIPVISKADTVSMAHMAVLKKNVWDSLKKANLDPLESLGLNDADEDSYNDTIDRFDERDEDELEHSDSAKSKSPESSDSEGSSGSVKRTHQRTPSAMSNTLAAAEANDEPYLPLSIISPDTYTPELVGRKFAWGFADPYNTEHCDFLKLKESVFGEWRGDLREASREKWYEGWRTSRLNRATSMSPKSNGRSPPVRRGVIP